MTLTAVVSLLLATVQCQGVIPAAPEAKLEAPVNITVELSKRTGPYKPIYSWFGYDEANFTTMRDGRPLLSELADLSPVPVYIRAHHLLTSGNGVPELKWSSTNVYTEGVGGKPVYDFKILDGIFDAYKTAGVRPMVELGFMPRDLATGPDPYQMHYPGHTTGGSVQSPPKDYAKWEELVRTVTAHLVERYGRDTVRTWYFEVWNEPDIDYWHGTPEEYWKLYDYAVAGVRKALPQAIVGGPASTGPGSGPDASGYKFLSGFLQHVSTAKSLADGRAIPLDFISFHAKGHPTIQGTHVQMGIRNELNDVDRGFEIVARFPKFKHLPIILSEADPEGCAACSSKVNPANNYRNGALYPAYTASAYKSLFDLENGRGVNLLGMLSWSFEFENRDYFEGFRDLSTNGIDKPILNFFRMAALMQGERVGTTSTGEVTLTGKLKSGIPEAPDVDAFGTVGEHSASVMLWNYSDSAEDAPATPVSVDISGLPASAKRVLLTHYRIDGTHSNAYTVWQAMGSPQQPTAVQYAELKRRAGLETLGSPVYRSPEKGELTLHTEMPRHSVSLLKLDW